MVLGVGFPGTQVLGVLSGGSTGSLVSGRSQGQQSEQRRQRPQRWEVQMSLVHQAQICMDGSAQIEQVKWAGTVTYDPLAGRRASAWLEWRAAV